MYKGPLQNTNTSKLGFNEDVDKFFIELEKNDRISVDDFFIKADEKYFRNNNEHEPEPEPLNLIEIMMAVTDTDFNMNAHTQNNYSIWEYKNILNKYYIHFDEETETTTQMLMSDRIKELDLKIKETGILDFVFIRRLIRLQKVSIVSNLCYDNQFSFGLYFLEMHQIFETHDQWVGHETRSSCAEWHASIINLVQLFLSHKRFYECFMKNK